MPGIALLIAGLGALAGAIVVGVLTVVTEGSGRARVARSLTVIDEVYGRDASRPGVPQADEPVLAPVMRRLGGLSARLSPAGINAGLARRLDLAGNPGGWNPERVLAFKGLGLPAGAVLGLFLGLHSLTGTIGLAVVLGAFGFYLPDILLYNTALKRREAIRRALPDVLDMLTVCVEAGLGFDAALAQVARNTTGPLAAECARMLQEMQIGVTRVDALRAMADRAGVAEVQTFTAAVVQATELGIPIADVLREQSREMRVRRRQRAEELAQKVPVKILFPVIFCIFPSLFVMIIGPGAINIMHAFSR